MAAAVPTIPSSPAPLTRLGCAGQGRQTSGDARDVSVCGDVIAREVDVDVGAERRIHDRLLVQRHGQPHCHAADQLATQGQRIDLPAR
jgi:hypothetical protein